MTKTLRVAVLAHIALVPPERPRAQDWKDAEWRCEYEVIRALRDLGHDVRVIGLYDDLTVIEPTIAEHRPHIVFNLMEEFDGIGFFDQNIVSYLELVKLRYTGCNPRGMMLARDKALAKKLLAFHGLPTPPFVVYGRQQAYSRPRVPELTFPMIVKTLNEEASLGISQASVVYDEEKLAERVRWMQTKFRTDVLVESFVDGRELYVGVIGNTRIEVLPPRELVFERLPEGAPRVATRRAKWDREYRQRNGIRSQTAELSPALVDKAQELAKSAYRVLGLSGYARIDMRLTPSGELKILEANPNPHIGRDEDFAQSARKAGLGYPELLSRILSLGLRWKPAG